MRSLLEARDARELGQLQNRLHHVDLLVLDELGFVPFDRAAVFRSLVASWVSILPRSSNRSPTGELLFNLLTARYERGSVIVTTNIAFGEGVKVFAGDEKLTTALFDRLAHHATVIATKGKSYRMRRWKFNDEKETTDDDAALPKVTRKA